MPQLDRVHVSFSCAKIGRGFVVLTLLVSIGAHWAVLRSVAWTQMLVERTQQGSFSKAVKTTFDGAHPCEMCKRIEHRQEEEQRHKSGQTIQKVKLDVTLATNAIAIHTGRAARSFRCPYHAKVMKMFEPMRRRTV